MSEEFKLLLSDRVNRYGLVLSILILLFGFVIFSIKVWSLSPIVPIFYHRPWGMPQLGMPYHLLIILACAAAMLTINLTIAQTLHRTIVLLSRILVWVSVLVSLLTTIAVVRVLFLV